MNEEVLTDRIRAEDILLGSVGIDGDASIVSVRRTESGYSGTGRWADGELFKFASEDELHELELWALEILSKEITDEQKSS